MTPRFCEGRVSAVSSERTQGSDVDKTKVEALLEVVLAPEAPRTTPEARIQLVRIV